MGGISVANELKSLLIDRAHTLLLFSILTTLTIIIDDNGEERKIVVQYRSGQIYENATLIKKIEEVLTIGKEHTPIWNYFLRLLFPNGVKGNLINIYEESYDILSSWLLTNFIARTNKGASLLIELIKCIDIKNMGERILSFITRSAEEDGGSSLLWWQRNFLTFWKWNGRDEYQEWIKNCFEIYITSGTTVQDCIANILSHFFSEIDANSEIYGYIKWLENNFKYNGKGEIKKLLERLNLQEKMRKHEENLLTLKK